MRYPSTNRFRARRGRMLRRQIEILAKHLKRDVVVLDVGGRPDYWANIGVKDIAKIIVLNHDNRELNRDLIEDLPENYLSAESEMRAICPIIRMVQSIWRIPIR